MRGLTATVLLVLLLSCCSALAHDAHEACSEENLARILKELEYLSDKRVDVDDLVRELDAAVSLCESGERSKAEEILTNIAVKVGSLLPEAERVYALKLIEAAAKVVFLSLVPVLVYLFLPRVYLSLWYRARRSWRVVRKG